jgi:MFS family permease
MPAELRANVPGNSPDSSLGMPDGQSPEISAWSPLTEPTFRALWIVSVTSNIGTLMQNVGAAWLMTTLSASPLMISLVQTAANLPVFLLALPAGALADVFDRRRILLLTQLWMLAAAAILGMMTVLEVTTPWALLGLTFLLGIGAAANAPAWQAIVPELVPRPKLFAAVALNGVGFNLARAVGPALGGLVVAAAGPGVVFLVNALSFLAVIPALYVWKRPVQKSTLPPEHMFGAILAGARYVRHSSRLTVVFLHAAIFSFFGSSLLALLPLFAQQILGLGSIGYGLLLGAFGVGAIVGAVILPRVRKSISLDSLVRTGILLCAAGLVASANLKSFIGMAGVMILAGAAWLAILSSFNTSIQVAVPSWVRGRAIAFFLLTFFGGMAGAGAFWGGVAETLGVPFTFLATAAGLSISVLATWRYRFKTDKQRDLTPSRDWPEHILGIDPQPESGPVLVTVEYRIEREKWREFTKAMSSLGRMRRRTGARRWDLFQDPADPSRYVETFLIESWVEHLRQHERFTVTDRQVLEHARSFHVGSGDPFVSHFIHADN